MNTLKDRLLQVIEKLGVTKSYFEKTVGFSNGFVDKSGDNTRKSSLDKISITYPNININWLLTGEGDMFIDNANKIDDVKNIHVIDNLSKALDEIAEQRKLVSKAQEQIDRLIGLLERR